jgi:hypothetical protein
MFTTIITDCKGENEAGRQISRFNSLGLGPTNLVGIDSELSDDATIEGGANLIDILDATEGRRGVFVLNVAPRGNKKDGRNGTHFAYFRYKDTLVISTIKGYCLSFVKKFELTQQVNIVELRDVLEYANNHELITNNLRGYIVKSQFRSFDFVPHLARWLIDGVSVPYRVLHLTSYVLPPSCIWCIDAFGNCKLTLTNRELPLRVVPCKVSTNLGIFTFYERLKDVPFGETALYTGSSGIGDKRFLEIATQGIPGSTASKLNLKIGDRIEIK